LDADHDPQRDAFCQDPDDTRAFEALEERFFLAADWEALVDLYTRRAQAPSLADDTQAVAALRFRMAQVLEERCLDRDRATTAYWEVARAVPGHAPALRQLRRLHAQRAQWDMVLQIAELESQADMEPYEHASFLAEMGRVWLDALGDANEALRSFGEALALDPHHVDALAGTAGAYDRLDRHAEAASTWEQLTEQLRGPDRAPAWVALARLLDGPLGDPARAGECYRRALGDDPRCAAAVDGLVRHARDERQWDLLSDLLERRFDLAAGARRRTAIAVEAARLHLDRTGNVQAARLWLERGRELGEDHYELQVARADLERPAGNAEALYDAVRRAVACCPDTPPASLLLEAAELESERGNDEEALAHLQRAQRRAPEDPLLLDALADHLARLGHHGELAEVLEHRIGLALAERDHDAATELLAELARLYEQELDDLAGAVETHRRSFRLAPTRADTCTQLERLYRKQEDWPALRSFLEQAVDAGPEPQRAELLASLGETLLELGESPETAADRFEQALGLDPRCSRALRGLERIASEGDDPEAALRAYRREAQVCDDRDRQVFLYRELSTRLEAAGEPEEALEWVRRWCRSQPEEREPLLAAVRLEEQLGDREVLIRARERLDPVLQGPSQAENRCAIAALQADHGREDRAIEAYERALESQPDCLEALQGLEPLYTGSRRPEELARVLRRLAELRPPPEARTLRERLADLLEEQLGDIDGAIVVLWQLVEGPNASTGNEERLQVLLDRAGRYEELAQLLLDRRRRLDDDDPAGPALDLQRARVLLEQLSQFEDAAALFCEVRARAPGEAADEGLERALRAANDTPALVELLAELAEAETDAARAAERRFERAVLLDEALDDAGAARRALETLLDAEPVAERVHDRLERLLERTADWPALRDLLARRLGGGDDERDLALHQRLAAIDRDRLGDREAAAAQLEAAARLAPEDATLWRNLALLYHELDRSDDLLRAMEAELCCCDELDREATLRARCARLCAGHEELHERAAEHYERLLAIEPGHTDAADFLLDLYERRGDAGLMVALLQEQLACETAGADFAGDWDPDAATHAVSLRLRIADLQARRLQDPEAAIAVLEPTLDDGALTAEVAEPLAELYRLASHAEPLVALCRRAAEELPAVDRPRWQRRLGAVLRDLGRGAEAAEAYREVLADRPGDAEAEAALRDLYRGQGEAEPLAELLRAEIGRLDPAAQVTLRLELANLLEGALEQPEDALDELRAVLQIDPTQGAAFQRALALAERQDRPDERLALIDARLAQPLPALLRAELLEQAGQLLAGPLARPEESLRRFREALALDRERSTARGALRSMLEQLGRWPAVLDCLYVEAHSVEGAERARIFERAVEVARQHVSADASLPWLERLRAERPEDPEVPARIAAVHREAGRPEALLRALEQELPLTVDPAHRRELRLERARVFEAELGSLGRATAVLEEARAESGDHPAVLRELERLYGLLGRTHDQAEALEAWLACDPPGDPETAVDRHERAAGLWAASLALPERAVPHLLRAVDRSRGDGPEAPRRHVELLRALGETLRAAGQPEAWVRAARAELALLDRTDEAERGRAVELQVDLGLVLEHDLARGPEARRILSGLLDQVAEARATGAPRPPLSLEQQDRMERALLQRLRIDRDDLSLERRLAERMQEGRGDAREWLELGHLRAERLHAPAAAALAFQRVLERSRDELSAIRGLRHVSECLGDWAEVARTYELELARAPEDPRECARLWQRLGDVRWHRLGVGDSAARAYREALAALPDDLCALRALQKLEEARRDFAAAADLLEREVEVLGEGEPERRHALWLRVADLAEQHLEDRARAIRACEAAERCGELSAERRLRFAQLYRDEGDGARYVDVLGTWCDDPTSGAAAADSLTLTEALRELGRDGEALERAERATERWPEHAGAWEALAALREERGDPEGAADALAAAAAHQPDEPAGASLLRAAELIDGLAPERSLQRLREATARDPGSAAAQAWLARSAERQGRLEEATTAAGRALDLDDRGERRLADSLRFDCALSGGRAARALGRGDAAQLFYGAALAIDPRCAEALDARAELRFDAGELAAARADLEARLDLRGDDPQHAHHLTLLGRCLEEAGELPAALDRYGEALAEAPDHGDAHAGVARIHERTGHADAAVAALAEWVRWAPEPGERALLRVRAAALETEAGRPEHAERLLRAAVADAPACEAAWAALLERVSDAGDVREQRRVAELALAACEEPGLVARLARARGEALEALDTPELRTEAAASYALAAETDPRDARSALDGARVLRAIGDWRPAADVLERFLGAHPDPDDRSLALVHYKRGRLLAGPLEDTGAAIACYERAIELDPDLDRAREPLANLLGLFPEHWRRALVQHTGLLAAEPARAASLRAVQRIAEQHGDAPARAFGAALLRAVGLCSPDARREAPATLPLPLAEPERLRDEQSECARQLLLAAGDELTTALEPPAPGARSELLAAVDRALGELASPLLAGRDADYAAGLVGDLARLALGDTPQQHPELATALGRWTRRRLRKALEGREIRDVTELDFEAWLAELRTLAAARAVDESGGDLRAALVALLAERRGEEAEPDPDEDLGPWLREESPARALLARATDRWQRTLLPES